MNTINDSLFETMNKIRQEQKCQELDRLFPGTDHEDSSCKDLCAEVCHIARMTGNDPAAVLSDMAASRLIPENSYRHAVPCTNYPGQSNDRPVASLYAADGNAQNISQKDIERLLRQLAQQTGKDYDTDLALKVNQLIARGDYAAVRRIKQDLEQKIAAAMKNKR